MPLRLDRHGYAHRDGSRGARILDTSWLVVSGRGIFHHANTSQPLAWRLLRTSQAGFSRMRGSPCRPLAIETYLPHSDPCSRCSSASFSGLESPTLSSPRAGSSGRRLANARRGQPRVATHQRSTVINCETAPRDDELALATTRCARVRLALAVVAPSSGRRPFHHARHLHRGPLLGSALSGYRDR